MLTLTLSLVGLLVAAAAFGSGGTWGNTIGAIATIVSAVATIRQYREGRPFEFQLKPPLWNKLAAGEYELVIPAKLHGKGRSPIVETYVESENGSLSVVIGDCHVSKLGDVTLGSSDAYAGRAVIK